MFPLDSDDVRFLLWLALGFATSLSFLSEFSSSSVSLLILVLLALAYSLVAYPQDLRNKYEIVRARFLRYTGKPNVLLNPLLLDPSSFWIGIYLGMLGGFFLIYLAYFSAMDFFAPRQFLFRLIYTIFGANSVVLITASLGTLVAGVSIEVIIGSRIEKANET